MRLAPESRIGPYEIVAPLGHGGMGEVSRARDPRLGRDVAIKVLPDIFSSDPERVARFEREARLLASLNHPHIAGLHGLEDADGVRCLVLELVEGPTLADRLRSGRLEVTEALTIARQVADALEAAHERGVIHRDLKPANVKLTPDGDAKVLDFGLARLAGDSADVALAQAPTITAGGTREGVILGTAAYMSPEQARGRSLDRRTDIWSFGCVLFELLTGRLAFPGETVSDTIMAVLGREPDWAALPERTPDSVRALLMRCLEKDPKRRLRDIGDARIEIDDALTTPARGVQAVGRGPGSRALPPGVALAGLILAAIAVGFAASGWLRPRAPGPAEPVRMTATLPPGVSVTRGPGLGFPASVALSPDGRTLVIAATGTDGQRLYQRPLDRLDATPVAGTAGGSSPFFSPDGAWIGFFAEGRLRRVPTRGGAAVDIAVVPGFLAGASWGSDDRIVFVAGVNSPVRAVSARGGETESLTTLEPGETGHFSPEILPDRRRLLFASSGWIHALDLTSGRRTRLVQGSTPRYVASGHVIVSRGMTLLAAPFNPSRLELTGDVVPLVDGVAPPGHYAISRSGTLAYVPAAETYAIVLVNADGTEHLITEERLSFENPQFSADGRRLAVATSRRRGEPADVWIHDLETGAASRLTFDGGRAPVWTPDGTAVTYSHLGEKQGLYTKPADGRGNARQLLPVEEFHWLVGWTPDGRTLAFGRMESVADDGISRSSILALADGVSRPVVGPGSVWGGRLSPDGRWLAYYELESGRFEVYVTPFPDGGTRWLITDDGGSDPTWAPDGREVYYRSGDRLMAARIETQAGVRVVSRRLVVQPFLPPLYDDYDIHPDGRTLVLVRPADDALRRDVVLVLDWLTELRRAGR
jgi:eukaryotic-like serine/threonine-protein kinase